MDVGYYLKARQILSSDIMKSPPHTREIWDYLLLKANHTDGANLLRGQCLTSYSEIIEALSWYVGWRKMSYKKHHCENSMKVFKKAGMITTKKTTRGMIVTIVKYKWFQDPNNYRKPTQKATAKDGRKLQCSATIQKNDKQKQKNKSIAILETKIAEVWNAYAKDEKLPQVRLPLSADRIKVMADAIKEFPLVSDWDTIIYNVILNDFNLGKNDRGWKASFDWLFHKTKFNYRKMMEADGTQIKNCDVSDIPT